MSRNEYDFEAAWQRVLLAAGARSQLGLAAVLGVAQSSVWDVRRRAMGIPASWLITLVECSGVSPVWIKTGTGPQFLTRPLADIPLAELMAELGRRHEMMFKLFERCGNNAAHVRIQEEN
ncbi:MAG: helix-turn-helix domain containing protein [Desulfobulbus sp.]|nr:helix-turn-helix domain containing protein [Desulfobulbus sp.]